MFYLTCLIIVALSQSTHTLKINKDVEHFKAIDSPHLENILKEINIGQRKRIQRINPSGTGKLRVFKIINSEEMPMRRQYTHLQFKDLDGIKMGLEPKGTIYFYDRKEGSKHKTKTWRKPKKTECRSKIERARQLYINHNDIESRRQDTENAETTNNSTEDVTTEPVEKYSDNEEVKVTLPKSTMELTSNYSKINTNDYDSQSEWFEKAIVPNDIFLKTEKKCANWLEDCNAMGVKDRLFKVLWSRYNS